MITFRFSHISLGFVVTVEEPVAVNCMFTINDRSAVTVDKPNSCNKYKLGVGQCARSCRQGSNIQIYLLQSLVRSGRAGSGRVGPGRAL